MCLRARRRSKKLGFLVQQESQVEPQLAVAQLEVAQAGAAQAGAAQAGAAQAVSQQGEDLRKRALRRSQKPGLPQQSDPHESLTAPQPPLAQPLAVPAPQPPGMGVETIGPDAGGAAWTASPALTDVSSRKSTFTGVFLRGSGD